MGELVTKSGDVAWGAAVIVGTRVPVETLFDHLKRGKTLDEFLEQFPTVSRDKAVAILELAEQGMAEQTSTNIGRSEIRRAIRMSDREREQYYLTSNRNMLHMFETARRSR